MLKFRAEAYAPRNHSLYVLKVPERIEEKVCNISVPLSYSEELYHLRMHIDLLRSKLKQMIEN